MRKACILRTLAALLVLTAPAGGDVLETRDGRILEGTYLGGTQQAVRFKAGDFIEVLLVEEVLAVTFTGPAPQAAAKPVRKPAAMQKPAPAPAPPARKTAATPEPAPETQPAPSPEATPPAAQPAPTPEATPPAAPAPAAPTLARVPAGTPLRVRMADGIDARKGAVGDRFTASLETGLGANGVAIVRAGTRLYGQIAELRATGPVASRLKLELTQVMIQGVLVDIVTGSHQLAGAVEAEPANASTIPARPGVTAGAVLEFRLLQPFDVQLGPR